MVGTTENAVNDVVNLITNFLSIFGCYVALNKQTKFKNAKGNDMKKGLIFISITLIISSLTFFINHAAAELKTISIGADVWSPYNGIAESNDLGFMVDIAVAIFKEKEYTINYKNLPWTRAKDQCRKGNLDAVVGAYKDDVPDFIFPEIEQGVSKTVFWVKKGTTWRYNGIQSLAKIRVGVIADYLYGEEFDNYVKQYKDNNERIQIGYGEAALSSNIKKLTIGRIGTFVEDIMVCSVELKNMKLSGEVVPAGQLVENNVYIAFSPKLENSKIFAKILTEGMINLRKTGQLKTILDTYGLSDWK